MHDGLDLAQPAGKVGGLGFGGLPALAFQGDLAARRGRLDAGDVQIIAQGVGLLLQGAPVGGFPVECSDKRGQGGGQIGSGGRGRFGLGPRRPVFWPLGAIGGDGRD